jgi:hypothetical protein
MDKSKFKILKQKRNFVIIAGIAGFIGCIGDFFAIFYLGLQFPRYSQLRNTMSSLGASMSPVSNTMSICWIAMGILIILFALGFRQAYAEEGRKANMITLLLILYGLGEGIGSGLFKADRINDSLTTSGIIHNVVGGIGVGALLVLPIVMQRIFTKSKQPYFYLYSKLTLGIGILFLLLFSFRLSNSKDNVLVVYQGLWQRLFILNYYIYLSVIIFIMIKKTIINSNKSSLT